jgi:hypothetical protein
VFASIAIAKSFMKELKLIWLDSKPLKLPTASIYKNGLLCFNNSASLLMKLDSEKRIKVAIDGTPDDYKNIFLQVVKDEADKQGAELVKIGSYYAIKFKNISELIGVDKQKFKVIADVIDNTDVFKLQPFTV